MFYRPKPKTPATSSNYLPRLGGRYGSVVSRLTKATKVVSTGGRWDVTRYNLEFEAISYREGSEFGRCVSADYMSEDCEQYVDKKGNVFGYSAMGVAGESDMPEAFSTSYMTSNPEYAEQTIAKVKQLAFAAKYGVMLHTRDKSEGDIQYQWAWQPLIEFDAEPTKEEQLEAVRTFCIICGVEDEVDLSFIELSDSDDAEDRKKARKALRGLLGVFEDLAQEAFEELFEGEGSDGQGFDKLVKLDFNNVVSKAQLSRLPADQRESRAIDRYGNVYLSPIVSDFTSGETDMAAESKIEVAFWSDSLSEVEDLLDAEVFAEAAEAQKGKANYQGKLTLWHRTGVSL